MKGVYIIAELSANHGHSLEIAIDTIRAAKLAGANAIKIQTYTANTITLDCDKDDFLVKNTKLWEGEKLYSLYQKAFTPWEWHSVIFKEARRIGIDCFSTPFDSSAVDLLENLKNPIYKVASFEITDIPLIEYIASKRKPIIISTGVATINDIELALNACRKYGNNDITLLKCTSSYPASVEDANLLTINDLKKRFNVKVGLSDHTMGADVAIAAVALGAEVIEKHFILDRSIGGPDCEFSMNQEEFANMVHSVRNVEKALGTVQYPTNISEIKGRQFSRSLYVAENMKAGDVITINNVRSVRPGYGLHPRYLPDILGKIIKQDVEKGTRFSLDLIK